MEPHRHCLVCESTKIEALAGYEQVGLVKCRKCSFVFMQQIPTEAELSAHYSTYSYDGERQLTAMTIGSHRETLKSFEPYRKNNRLLDVGCGVGNFLEVAREQNWQVFGTEYSGKAVEIASAKGIAMKQGPLNVADFEPGFFDVITSFEVIEHINNPIEELQKIYALLRPGGLFYCTTPNFNSLLRYWFKAEYKVIEYPEHLSYYTKKTLSKAARQVGFEPVKTKTTGFSFNQVQRSSNALPADFQFSTSADEKLRSKIHKSRGLKVVKNMVNFGLTATGTGMILKAYFRKPA